MIDLDAIVSAYKRAKGIEKDFEAAEQLHVKKNTFSQCRSGKRRFSDLAIVEFAEAIGADAADVMAAVNAAFHGTPEEERALWQSRLERSPLVGRLSSTHAGLTSSKV